MSFGRAGLQKRQDRSQRKASLLWQVLPLPVLLVLMLTSWISGCAGLVTTSGSNSSQAAVQVTPSSFNFGSLVLGKKTSQVATVANTGNTPISITAATLSSGQFSVSGLTMPLTLPVGQSNTFQVWFDPNAVGSPTGTLTIQTGNGVSSEQVALKGVATAPVQQISLSSTNLNLGSVAVGTTSSGSLTIGNTGGANLLISLISVSGSPFGVSGMTTPSTVGPGASATLGVSFSPTTAGNDIGSILITSNDPQTPTATVALTGTATSAAVAPTITTQPVSQTVTAGQTATFAVVASGTAPLGYQWQKNGANISGATAASYTTPATTTSDSGSTFDVVVSNTAGSVTSGTATLTVNAAAAPLTITTTSLPSGQVNSAYTATMAASGGTAPYSWLLSSGSLPAGLTLSGSGQISGTATASGTFSFTVKVTDSGTPAQSASSNFSLTISVTTGGGATLVLCPNNGETGNNAICASSPVLTFGNQGTNTPSAALTISVNNCSTPNIAVCTGTGSLTLDSPYFTITGANAADFSNTGLGTCSNGLGINSGSDCTIVLRFTPSQASGTNESATLTVNSNGAGNPHTMSLSGTSATVTAVSSCQALNGSTNYQLMANVSASGTCFTVGGSNTDINLNGYTITFCTASSSSLVGGVFMTGNPTSGTTVHNGTITEGAGLCTGLTPSNGYGSGGIIASSDGSSSVSRGTTVFNMNITVNSARAKVVFEENAGNATALGTTIHDVIYTDNDSYTCGNVGCRDVDQGYPIVVDQSSPAGPTVVYNVTGAGSTQGGIVSTAPNSQFYSNFIAPGNLVSTNTNGFIFQDWGPGTMVENNLTTGSGMDGSCLSCRGVQVSSANNRAVTGTVVQNNVLYTTNLNNDIEYGGCQIDGSYGMQINTAGSNAALSNNTFQNNKVMVTSSVCPGFGFSWSGATAGSGPNKTQNNTFVCRLALGFTAGPCAGARFDANQYNPGIAAVVGTGDTYVGDTSAIYIWYDGTPTWTCNQCTFGKGANATSNWVMLDYDGGGQSGQSSQPMFLVDPTFTGGATKDSNNLSNWASNNGSLSFSYTIQWTYAVTVKGATSGSTMSGAAVTITDSQSGQECSGTTNSSGVFSCVVNDTKYAATSGHYTTTSYSPFTISIAKPGCAVLNYNQSFTSTTTETRTIPGC